MISNQIVLERLVKLIILYFTNLTTKAIMKTQ